MHQVLEAGEVARIQRISTPQRESHTMDRQHIVLANLLQDPDHLAAAHIILSVDLKPCKLRTSAQDLGHVWCPESDTSAHGAGALVQSLSDHDALSFCSFVLYAVNTPRLPHTVYAFDK